MQQIQHLQEQAKEVMAQAAFDQKLHRAECRFKRIAGHCYHLYERDSGELYFSMLSPNDWKQTPPNTYLGGYQLQADMSWKVL